MNLLVLQCFFMSFTISGYNLFFEAKRFTDGNCFHIKLQRFEMFMLFYSYSLIVLVCFSLCTSILFVSFLNALPSGELVNLDCFISLFDQEV